MAAADYILQASLTTKQFTSTPDIETDARGRTPEQESNMPLTAPKRTSHGGRRVRPVPFVTDDTGWRDELYEVACRALNVGSVQVRHCSSQRH